MNIILNLYKVVAPYNYNEEDSPKAEYFACRCEAEARVKRICESSGRILDIYAVAVVIECE